MMDLLDKVRGTISRYQMLSAKNRVLVAVSGGPDSVALLDLLVRLREEYELTLVVAHYHHRLRGEEADRDLELVRKLAEDYKLEFIFAYAPEGWWEERRGSLEEEARRLRYQFLEESANRLSLERIALGHNAGDRVESFFLNLLRGSGRLGLAGMPPVRDKYIRPLIELSREEILEYLKERELPFRLDTSNLDPGFLRNRIRQELIPLLKRYNPNLLQVISRTCELLREDESFLEEYFAREFEQRAEFRKDAVEFSVAEFVALPRAVQRGLIRRAIQILKGDLRRITAEHIFQLEEYLDSEKASFELDLPGGIRIYKSYDSLRVEKEGEAEAEFSPRAFEIGEKLVLELSWDFFLELETAWKEIQEFEKESLVGEDRASIFESGGSIAWMDLEEVEFPLCLKPPQPGERLEALGLKGKKKLKDIFMELKVPRHLRRIYPLVSDQRDLLWVPGYGISEKVMVKGDSKKIARLILRLSRKGFQD